MLNIFSIKVKKGSFLSTSYPSLLIIKIFGLTIKFNLNKTFIKRIPKSLYMNCDIENLDYILSKNPKFTHMTGIIINKDVQIGENCIIRHNVTLGEGKYNENTKRCYPILGDNVDIGAGSIIIGGINIGNNVIIGAGSVVVKDAPDNVTVAGNPARIIKHRTL